MSNPSLPEYLPLPDWALKHHEGINPPPKLTLDDIYSGITAIFVHFFRPQGPQHFWIIKRRHAIHRAATSKTKNKGIDDYRREVDADARPSIPDFVLSSYMNHDKARLVVSIVGTKDGSEEKGFKRLERWTKKLYQGLDDAHGARQLQGLLVTGLIGQFFDIVKEGDAVNLVSASGKMCIRSPEFHTYLHGIACEPL